MTQLLFERETEYNIKNCVDVYEYLVLYCAGVWQDCMVIYFETRRIRRPRVMLYNCNDKMEHYLEGELYPYIYKNYLFTIHESNMIIREGTNVKKLPYISCSVPKCFSEYIVYHEQYNGNTFVTNMVTSEMCNLDRSFSEKQLLGVFKHDESEYLLSCDYLTLQKYHIKNRRFVSSVEMKKSYEYAFVSDKIYMFCDLPFSLHIYSLNLECEYIIRMHICCHDILSACKIGSNIMFGGDELFSIDLNTIMSSDKYLLDIQNHSKITKINKPQYSVANNDTIIHYMIENNTLVRNITELEGKFIVETTNAILWQLRLRFKKIYEMPKKLIKISIYSDKPYDIKNIPSKYRELFVQLMLITRRILSESNIFQVGIPKDIILYIVELVYCYNVYY